MQLKFLVIEQELNQLKGREKHLPAAAAPSEDHGKACAELQKKLEAAEEEHRQKLLIEQEEHRKKLEITQEDQHKKWEAAHEEHRKRLETDKSIASEHDQVLKDLEVRVKIAEGMSTNLVATLNTQKRKVGHLFSTMAERA